MDEFFGAECTFFMITARGAPTKPMPGSNIDQQAVIDVIKSVPDYSTNDSAAKEACMKEILAQQNSRPPEFLDPSSRVFGLNSIMRPKIQSQMEIDECSEVEKFYECSFSPTRAMDNFFLDDVFKIVSFLPDENPNYSPVLGTPSLVRLSSSFSGNFNQFMKSRPKSNCDCIKEKVDAQSIINKDITVPYKKEKNRLTNLALQSFGEKFLNNFATNVENVTFYHRNTGDIFEKEQEEKLLCDDPAPYMEKVNSKCANVGISEEDKKKRLDTFLGALGNTDSHLSFDRRFSKINNEILEISVVNKDGSKSLFNRWQHDEDRHSFSLTNNKAILANTLLTELMKGAYQEELDDEMVNSSNPIEAIMNLIDDKAVNEGNNLFRKLIENGKISGPEKTRLKALLNSQDSEKIKKEFKDAFSYAVDVHPGLATALFDKKLFSKLSSSVKSKRNESAISLLNSQKDIIPPFLKKNCNDLIEQFSEAVCTPSNEIISKIPKADLSHILATEDKKFPGSKHWLFGQLLCEYEDRSVSGSAFSDLPASNKTSLVSDYMKRKNSTLGNDGFTKAVEAMSNDDFYRDQANLANKQTEKLRKASSNLKIAARLVNDEHIDRSLKGEAKLISNKLIPLDDSVKKISSTVSQDSTQEKFVPETAIQDQSFVERMLPHKNQLSQVGPTPLASSQISREPASVSKSSFIDQVSSESNRKEIQKHVANLEEKHLAELQKLKNQNLLDRTQMLEQENVAEENKLNALKSRLDGLLAKKQNKSPEAQKVTEMPLEDTGEKNLREDSKRRSGMGPTNTTQANSAQSAPTFPQSNLKSESASQLGKNSTSSLGSKNDGVIPGKGRGQDSGPGIILTINSSNILNKDPGNSEISQEIISYLNQSLPDASVLSQIKDEGMLYKFKVMENGKLIERELMVKYDLLTPEARSLIDTQLGSVSLEQEIVVAKREHSYQTLKMLIMQQHESK